jgi:hypothetical protein
MQNQRDPTKLNTDGNWKEKGARKNKEGEKKRMESGQRRRKNDGREGGEQTEAGGEKKVNKHHRPGLTQEGKVDERERRVKNGMERKQQEKENKTAGQ